MKFERDIKFFLTQEIFEQLKACVNNARPNEACGFIFGKVEEINKDGDFEYHYIAQKFYCIESTEKSPVAFLISNTEKLNEVFLEASKEHALQLVSIFHSHPGGAHPSGVDANNMQFLNEQPIKAFKSQIWTIMDASNYNLNGFIFLNDKLLQIDVSL